jgi:putative aminopeptidase
MPERYEESSAGHLDPADRVPRRARTGSDLAPSDLTSPRHHRFIRLPSRLPAFAAFLLNAGAIAQAVAQEPSSVPNLALQLASVSAVTGYEQALVDTLLRLLPGARRDRAGSARLQLGGNGGANKRLLVCPLDEPGYVVGAIRQDGYLTLRRTPGRVPRLFDQQLEGHRVTILGARGPIPGVVAVRSIHLTRGRDAPSEEPFTVDDAYVDVGAVSAAEATRLGARVLAPTTLTKRPHRYGNGLLAAPVAGRRAACAALLVAAQQSKLRAKLIPPVTVAFAVQHELLQRGLATLANASGPFKQTLIVDGRQGVLGSIQRNELTGTTGRMLALGRVAEWSLPVRHAGTAVETVSLTDADSLRGALVRWIGDDQ